MQNDIVIDQNISQNENPEKKEVKKEDIISNNNEPKKTDNNAPTEMEMEKVEKVENKETNETDSNISPNNNNNNNISENDKSPIDTKKNNNIEENYQNNIIKTEHKSDRGLVEKILEEEGEYTPIENILHEQQSKTDVLKNNSIYVTETNDLITMKQSDIRKSNSNKLYVLTSIPEYSNVTVKKKAETPMKTYSVNRKNNNKNKKSQICLNNLSPEIYMKKRIGFNHQNVYNNLKNRIKRYEEDIQKKNDYDYKRAMKECEMQYNKEMRNKEKEKQIMEEHKKFEEKLKNMEEYRNNLVNAKIKNTIQRLKSRNRNKQNLNKSFDSNENDLSIKDRVEKINSENIFKTLELYEAKLPLIENLPKYELIKIIKDKEEEIFCTNTEHRLKSLENNHKKNYLKHIHDINNKLIKQNQLYNQRSEKCIYVNKEKNAELEEKFIEKEMIRRYNIQMNVLRELSAKKEKAKENLLKNIDNLKEKKELLKRQEQQKIKQIIKRLNRHKIVDLKKTPINNATINNQRNYFANLQKENLNKANKEITDYYKELMLRREDYFWIINDMQKDENKSRTTVYKNILQNQNQKNNEMKSLNKYLDKMEKENINHQKGGIKMKLYLEKRKVDIENKKKEEEEAIA